MPGLPIGATVRSVRELRRWTEEPHSWVIHNTTNNTVPSDRRAGGRDARAGSRTDPDRAGLLAMNG